ncbi:MAG: hypothetical protein IPP45_00070 [Sphingomonadales bacterium]|nr:hypothetical protein [Sphingomonadales bacterium]
MADAAGRVLAEPIHAVIASPRRAVSAMDGYALRDSDAAVGARFRIIGESFAGGPPPPALSAGECGRIFTGAALPVGSDRVVMQENLHLGRDRNRPLPQFGPGWHVRQVASDFAEGDLLLPAGTLLDARNDHIGSGGSRNGPGLQATAGHYCHRG